ncbi:CaiB/BaiF CoA-transferase family protein [Piscinibacter sakaiensis]|uniref:CaiB/BaiF CoA transferase family protein n=1 Tax=Piscinibacter sakaiensis TaxID=1547922 RepID=UPI0037284FDD
MSGVLAGLRVLEFAAIGPVPWCGMLLADLGADIVRIERPGSHGEPDTLGAVRRGRTCVEIDLKTPDGRRDALALAAAADVLLEGLRPGAMERLGLGPDDARARNPRLVYARMTGWGQTGPLAQQAGHDINYIALTGALHAIGTPDRPLPPLNLVGDYGGGGAFLAIGLLAAAWEARRSGHGRTLDVSMVDGSAALMATLYSRLQMGQWRDERGVNRLDGGLPWYDTYRTGDGRFVAVGALEPAFYAALVRGLDLEADLPDRDAEAHWPEIRRQFAARFASRTRDEWAAHFAGTDACVTPVLSLAEAPRHPHPAARGTGHVPAAAFLFDGVRPPPGPASTSASPQQAIQAWSSGTAPR